ncbi:MAG: glycosyltransferase family 4 protein [Crocosphaera sp.]|nr:glycosyltransferase family 4 protein [Crocosphaera sp.]
MNPKILWLRKRFNWMGKHSGYDQLCQYLPKLLPDDTYQSVWQNSGNIRNPLLLSIIENMGKKAKGSPMYNSDSSTIAELKVILKGLQWHPDLIHVTYVENQLGILQNWKQRLSCKIIGTSHQPAGWWRLVHRNRKNIANLDALIVVGSKEVEYFQKYLPGRVFFIPHGVDTNFFCPLEDSTNKKDSIRCIFSGKHLRDLETLASVIDKVLRHNPTIQFDIIMPTTAGDRNNQNLIRLARHPQVHWYQGVSDRRLRKLYQQASMLVLPIIDCTANNALVEAISCGLPVISNDVGGLLDYTRDTFAELLPIGDVDGFVNAILRLAEDSQEQHVRGKAARQFAEEHLDWVNISNKTMDIYQKIIFN